jgi:hypothetical protein
MPHGREVTTPTGIPPAELPATVPYLTARDAEAAVHARPVPPTMARTGRGGEEVGTAASSSDARPL